MARCLNPRAGGSHENPDTVAHCQFCDFLIQGAHIGIYEVVSFLGAGSYGYVYKVRESAPLSRILALKVLRLDQSNEKARASFMQEARRIANMHHPNILPIYNFGHLQDSEQPYFVMEYAPRTILDLFRKDDGSRRQAFAEELIPYVQQTTAALHYLHSAGLVHQDVKLGNLLIGRSGQVLLADFGTTYYLGMQTHASLGEVTGTAAYMPPEQWQGNPRRHSDQYALAICCYELLCSRPPFIYQRLEDMWNAHLKEQPPSLQRWNPRVPVEVAAVLQRAMAKDYRQRYHGIDEFADNYAHAVQIAMQRYICQNCGQQNRTGAQRCTVCGEEYDNRYCLYCHHPARLGQRCCSICGRLADPPTIVQHSPLMGVSVCQGRYTIKRVLKQSKETQVMVAVASDTQNKEQPVVLKRWECTEAPLSQRARDITYYDRATEQLVHLHHPLVPPVLNRFAEGTHYYAVLAYIDGESLEERLLKLLRPLPEKEIIGYMNILLNVLISLEQRPQPLHHFDISPANILIEHGRGRVMLTGFQVQPPPQPPTSRAAGKSIRTTRKLAVSPYLPIQDKTYDQRTSIYALAASMHHALTNVAPPHYPFYPPVRLLNPAISSELETILSRALLEEPSARYQNYAALRKDIQRLTHFAKQ
ncbi:MAG TPA: protein kinase [Ktedonobacteraceae bacterium]|nr:protein kinase [Ktedonobacteraceae bacterium]